jgi:acyl carrier protein
MKDGMLDAGTIQSWCLQHAAQILNVSAGQIDPNTDVDRFGLDSAMAVALIMELEEWLEIELAPELLFEFPTIAGLSRHLASRVAAA